MRDASRGRQRGGESIKAGHTQRAWSCRARGSSAAPSRGGHQRRGDGVAALEAGGEVGLDLLQCAAARLGEGEGEEQPRGEHGREGEEGEWAEPAREREEELPDDVVCQPVDDGGGGDRRGAELRREELGGQQPDDGPEPRRFLEGS